MAHRLALDGDPSEVDAFIEMIRQLRNRGQATDTGLE
jgi:hypothetical protein